MTNVGEQANLNRRTPTNLYAYSAFKKVEQKSPLFNYRLHIVTSFQRIQYGKGEKRITSIWKNLTNIAQTCDQNKH